MSVKSLDNLFAKLAPIMMSFQDKEELDSLYTVNKLFKELVIQECRVECKAQDFIPESLPIGVNYKNFFVDLFPNRIDADFIRQRIGEVGEVPPVPVEFIQRVQP